ncbi:MAG: biotin transporter BioY [Selenomonadaceae bacterium]|nr:biotin transporter BioY [Selenomonadaceae bacterium]
MGTRNTVKDMTRMSICLALICVSAYIAVPVPFAAVVVTAVTMTMNLAAFLLTPMQTFIVLVSYILLGVAGLPVFANGSAGIGQLFGPSGGFLISFCVAYPVVSMLKGDKPNFRRYMLAALLGIPISYIGGIYTVMTVLKLTLNQTLLVAALPYIPFDIMKGAMAAVIGIRLQKALH